MITFSQAFEVMMNSARALGSERVGLENALGRILAEDVASDIEMPPFNKSAMDGFACRRDDLANELVVIETIAAGVQPKKTIGQDQCSKIMTGAVVPEGADCVVMKEYIEETGDNKIRFVGEKTKDNICLKGEDIKQGDVVLSAGCEIKAQHIAVLAGAGCVRPLVSLQPRVGIIATGNELVDPERKPSSCQIRNTNGLQLAAQVKNAGAIAKYYGIAADTHQATDVMVKKAIAENDVVILSGGVSVGDYDVVREVLRNNNIDLLFEKVAIKPGRPMVFGLCEKAFCFGLPGNPVSTFVLFELMVKPFLFKIAGVTFKPCVTCLPLGKTITRKKTDRDAWLPAAVTEDGKIEKIEYHGSAHINALCKADGLLCMPTGVEKMEEGVAVAIRQI